MTMIEKLRLKDEIDARNEEAIKRWEEMTRAQKDEFEKDVRKAGSRCVVAVMGASLLLCILEPVITSALV